MLMSNKDFEKEVIKMARMSKSFEPSAYYDSDGDCLEFFIKNDDYYAERVDELLTVYYSRQNNEIIGSLIKGFHRLYENIISKMPGFAIEIKDGRVQMAHLFRARLWTKEPCKKNKIMVKTYQKLVEFADEHKTIAEVQLQ